ncbi:Signal transduction histidine kinase [Arboricoccus pini]|uniref:histidine kinase n=1 Tax=Arboricoccus pini TaxID=1963835 RepID=A0A212Q1K2_9PROT|nr:HAMP domain-containing sensor histidine kinase [Arboricoccus pini]SNB53160.1 Signal transduction histidine kinase [Arboricoccus pini]
MSDATKQLPECGLSAKIMVIAIILIFLGELLIFIPALDSYRSSYLDQRVVAAQLAVAAVNGGATNVSPETIKHMLDQVGVVSVSVSGPTMRAQFGPHLSPTRVFDLRETSLLRQFSDTAATILFGHDRMVGITSTSPLDDDVIVDIVINENPMRQSLLTYAGRTFLVSLLISSILGIVLFLTLRRMFVLPMTALALAMTRFRRRPDDTSRDPPPPAERRDAIGIVEREFNMMRDDVRQALVQRHRLAALGAAVTQITHDLRNILSAAVLLSDRLEASQDPIAREVGPRLVGALDRAVRLCADATTFARGRRSAPEWQPFALLPMVNEVRETLAASGLPREAWTIKIAPDLEAFGDRNDLFRVLLALTRNARDASTEQTGSIEVSAHPGDRATLIYVSDNGRGIPEAQRASLFDVFVPHDRPDGRGLGLVVCREIMRAHGGEIELVSSKPGCTTFRLILPTREAVFDDQGKGSDERVLNRSRAD